MTMMMVLCGGDWITVNNNNITYEGDIGKFSFDLTKNSTYARNAIQARQNAKVEGFTIFSLNANVILLSLTVFSSSSKILTKSNLLSGS
jgi:hypothetical protein